MRRTTTKAIKVEPGDAVVVRATLPPSSGLARLYVWAKQEGSQQFSPYVQNTDVIGKDGMPTMLTPLSMRLVEQRPSHRLSFVSDIEGQVVIVQEVDTSEDKLADVTLDLNMATKSRLNRFKRRWTEWPKTVTL